MEVESCGGSADGAVGDGVGSIGHDAATGDGQRIERAIEAVSEAGRAVRRREVAAFKQEATGAIERKALDRGSLLDVAQHAGGDVGRRRDDEGDPPRRAGGDRR